MALIKSIVYPKTTSKDIEAKVDACVETAYNKFMNRQDDINKWKELAEQGEQGVDLTFDGVTYTNCKVIHDGNFNITIEYDGVK